MYRLHSLQNVCEENGGQKMCASCYVKAKYEPACICHFRSAVVHQISRSLLFW